MEFSRRRFLGTTAGIAFGAWVPSLVHGAQPDPVLRAMPGRVRLVPGDYPETPIWGYEGGVPGPVIRLTQGERVTRRFINRLPQPSTVHWHGIRIANSMDGVPELTQLPVEPDGEYVYAFDAPDAGTYWYHSHNRSWEQVARGLYGPLIVEEREGPEVDRDEILALDDWRVNRDASIDESFGAMMDWGHAGRLGNWMTVNGRSGFALKARENERLRLRLLNVSNARIMGLAFTGLDGWVAALDGQPLERPSELKRLVLAPAQRVDLIVDVTAASGDGGAIDLIDGSQRLSVVRIEVEGAARRTRLGAPAALPPNPVAELGNVGDTRKQTLRMEGGAMGGMGGAMMGGRMLGMRGLIQAGKMWAFNGTAGMTDTPLLSAGKGETVRIEMINDTAWPHAMHLHGHHFRRVGPDGRKGPLRDTLLVNAKETAEIAFVADNPGKWLLHCHMLEHSAGGMMTWVDVAG